MVIKVDKTTAFDTRDVIAVFPTVFAVGLDDSFTVLLCPGGCRQDYVYRLRIDKQTAELVVKEMPAIPDELID